MRHAITFIFIRSIIDTKLMLQWCSTTWSPANFLQTMTFTYTRYDPPFIRMRRATPSDYQEFKTTLNHTLSEPTSWTYSSDTCMGLEKYFVFLLGMQSVPLGHFDAARQAGDQEDLWVVPDELMIGDRGGRDGIHDQEGLWCQQAPDCVCWNGREGVYDQEAVWFLASGTVWRPSWAEVCWSIGACAQLLAKGQRLRSRQYSITLLPSASLCIHVASLYPIV